MFINVGSEFQPWADRVIQLLKDDAVDRTAQRAVRNGKSCISGVKADGDVDEMPRAPFAHQKSMISGNPDQGVGCPAPSDQSFT